MAELPDELTPLFWTVLRETAGVVPASRDALNIKGVDSKLVATARPAQHVEAEVAAGTLADAADAVVEISEFERRLARRGAGRTRANLVDSLAWSPDAEALLDLIAKEGLPPGARSKYTTRRFLQDHFRVWKFPNVKLSEVDAGVRAFRGLRELTLSGNNVEVVRHLPPNVQSINLYANRLRGFALEDGPAESVVHLGAGYNYLDEAGLLSVARDLPNVMVLDVGCNSLTNLEQVLTIVESLPKLRHLYLAGNPVALAVDYRTTVIRRLPELESLDEYEITPEFREELAETDAKAAAAADATSRDEGETKIDAAAAADGEGDAEGAGGGGGNEAKESQTSGQPGPPPRDGSSARFVMVLNELRGLLTPQGMAPAADAEEDAAPAKGKKGKKPAKKKGKAAEPEPEDEAASPPPKYFVRVYGLDKEPFVSPLLDLSHEWHLGWREVVDIPVSLELREFCQFGRVTVEVCEQPQPEAPVAEGGAGDAGDGSAGQGSSSADGGEGKDGDGKDGGVGKDGGDGGGKTSEAAAPEAPAPVVLARGHMRIGATVKASRRAVASVREPVTLRPQELPTPTLAEIEKRVTAAEKAAEEKAAEERDGDDAPEPTAEELEKKASAHRKAVRAQRRQLRDTMQVKTELQVCFMLDSNEALPEAAAPPEAADDG